MMDLSNDELGTVWKALDNLAVGALKERSYRSLSTHQYVVEDNKLYWEAIGMRDKIGTELETRKAAQCNAASK